MKEERIKAIISACKRTLKETGHNRACKALIYHGGCDGAWITGPTVKEINEKDCSCWRAEMRIALRLKDKEIK